MPLNKTQKQNIINDLKDKVAKQKAIVFADFKGLKVKNLSILRKEMKSKECELKVAKKSLISIVLKAEKIEADIKKMEGEIIMGFGYKDEILPFKLLYDFSKSNENLKLLGGLIKNEFVSKEKAIEFGQLLSKEDILGQLFFSVQRNLNVLKVRS